MMILKIILIAVSYTFASLGAQNASTSAGQLGSRAIGNTLEVVCQEVEADLKVEALRYIPEPGT